MNHRFYGSMAEYTKEKSISHYCLFNIPDSPDVVIHSFQPIIDRDIVIDYDDRVDRYGKEYYRVDWGESHTSYIEYEAICEECYARYLPGSTAGVYVSDGVVYASREDAEAATTWRGAGV